MPICPIRLNYESHLIQGLAKVDAKNVNCNATYQIKLTHHEIVFYFTFPDIF